MERWSWLPVSEVPGAWLARGQEIGGASFVLVAEGVALEELWSRALALGEPHGLRPVGEEAYQAIRIRAGVVEGGAEVTERANPMELGLADSYSLTKGCFTGQEVLAKMETHQSVKRALVGLELSGETSPGRDEPLRLDGADVGRITSAAQVPGSERRIGLALVRVEHGAPETSLEWGEGTAARVTSLPIPDPAG